MGFLQIHIFILCLTFGYYNDQEEQLGHEDRKLSENVGDRYEAIGEMQEKHMLTPGWFNSFEKEHPISQPWAHKRHEHRRRERRPRSHEDRRSRSHRREDSRHLKDQMRDYDRHSSSRRHRQREKNHRSSDGRRPSHRKSSHQSDHYSSDGRTHHHHREKNRDNAGNYDLPNYHSKSRKIEKETGFHSKHSHHRKVSTKKMFGTQVHWVPNMFAESSVKKIQKAQNTCDCSKCEASPKPASQKAVQDQPEVAAAVPRPHTQAAPNQPEAVATAPQSAPRIAPNMAVAGMPQSAVPNTAIAQPTVLNQPEVAAAAPQSEPQIPPNAAAAGVPQPQTQVVPNVAIVQPMQPNQPEVAAASPQSVPPNAVATQQRVQTAIQNQPEVAAPVPGSQFGTTAVQNQPEVAAAAPQSGSVPQFGTAPVVPPPASQKTDVQNQPEVAAAAPQFGSQFGTVPVVPPPASQSVPKPPSIFEVEIPAASTPKHSNAQPQAAPLVWPQAPSLATNTDKSIWPDSPPQTQVASLVKQRRKLSSSGNNFSQDDVLEFGSRDFDEEREVSNNGCPTCCKEKQSGWSKPEVSVGYHIEEP